jgi:hypothetical protein
MSDEDCGLQFNMPISMNFYIILRDELTTNLGDCAVCDHAQMAFYKYICTYVGVKMSRRP